MERVDGSKGIRGKIDMLFQNIGISIAMCRQVCRWWQVLSWSFHLLYLSWLRERTDRGGKDGGYESDGSDDGDHDDEDEDNGHGEG